MPRPPEQLLMVHQFTDRGSNEVYQVYDLSAGKRLGEFRIGEDVMSQLVSEEPPEGHVDD